MPQYWHIVEALLALHKQAKGGKVPAFNRADLRAWSDKIRARPTSAQLALDHMERSGFVRRVKVEPGKAKQGMCSYAATPEGMAAAKAAYDSWKHAALSAAGAKASRPRQAAAFAARLWSLLRMRKSITPPEAAATLVDAGDNVATATGTASQYLRSWSAGHPEAIQISKQRGARGALRYVLVKDLGPVPPVTTKKARGGATA